MFIRCTNLSELGLENPLNFTTGPPFIRSIGPTKAVAGTDAIIHCPYSGYPIKSVRWERHGQELPQDVRHRLEEGGLKFHLPRPEQKIVDRVNKTGLQVAL